jgi:hypothetical protein
VSVECKVPTLHMKFITNEKCYLSRLNHAQTCHKYTCHVLIVSLLSNLRVFFQILYFDWLVFLIVTRLYTWHILIVSSLNKLRRRDTYKNDSINPVQIIDMCFSFLPFFMMSTKYVDKGGSLYLGVQVNSLNFSHVD